MSDHIADRAIEHLKKEIGKTGLERYEMIDSVYSKHWDDYAQKYGNDIRKWPAGEYVKFQKEADGIIDTLTPPHLKKSFQQLADLEPIDPNWPDAEDIVRKTFPDIVSRMESGQVQPIEEPRAPVPQPQMPTPAPVKTREPPRPAMPAPMQKPAEVKQPKTTVITGPSSLRQRERQLTPFEKAVIAQRDKWEKEGLFTPPPMQDMAKQRLLQMHDKEEEEVPVSLPEAVNPTAR